ncbi:MAG: GGDEF domain-containing protein [Mogibacterium sp.]|nr:GGDEF domain-containing protein [Mogibacterium sp.]
MIQQQDEQLRAELERLQARYDFLLAAVDNLPNPIFMKDEDARFFFFNKAYSEFFNMKRIEYIGKSVLDLDYLPPEDRERYQNEDLKAIQQLDVISYDATFTAPDGEDHPTYYWSRGFEDTISGKHGLVGEIVDLYKERKADVYNRSVLWDKDTELVESGSANTHLVFFDLDNFSTVNEKFGHMKGDEMLAQFAGFLRSESRPTDLPVRYGGDEFILVLNGADVREANDIAEKVRKRCEKDLLMPDGTAVTVTAGICAISESDNIDSVSNRIQEHIAESKKQGRNRVIIMN